LNFTKFRNRKKDSSFMKKHSSRNIIFLICLTVLSALLTQTAYPCFADSGDDGAAFDEEVIVVDPTSGEEGFSAILYDNTNGLPTSEANDIAETADGFIWIGSYSGLVRYDGNRFERLDSTSGITSVKCLFVDSRDRLWIGTNESGVFLMENGTFRKWNELEGLAAPSVRAITEDAKGVIYVATTGGITMIDEEMNLIPLRSPGITGAFVNFLKAAPDGRIYGVTNPGDVFTMKDGALEGYIDHAAFSSDGVNCLFPDPENPGYVYIETMDSVLSYGSLDKTGYQEVRRLDIGSLSQVSDFEYIDGKIWICARNGIGVLDDSGYHSLEELPLDNSVGKVIVDYEGNLWFTSSRQGVMKITPNRFTNIFEHYKLPENVVNSTCMFGDRLFIAADDGLIVLDQNRVLGELPIEKAETVSGEDLGETDLLKMLDGCRIRSLIRDSSGRLWISTWRKYGLLRYDGRTVTAFTSRDGLFSDHIRTVCERKDGSFAVALTGGVNIIEGDRVTGGFDEKDGIVNTEILTVAEGAHGELLCGSDGDGIYVIDGSRTMHIGPERGLTSGAVMRIKKDPYRDIYWIVTGSSIAYMTEKYEINTIDKFPYFNNFDLYENSSGEVWVLNSNGIYIAKSDDLVANENIDPMRYSISDGLPCIATANSYSELTEEGDLYIAGTTGVAKVNIEEPYDSVGNLKAAVPYIEADGERVYPDESGMFKVPFNVRKLTIYGFVYNYSLINPQVNYQLVGFDTEPVTVTRSNLGPVDYTNLQGGTYEFVMQLRDPVSRRYKTVSVRIVKEKAFYEYARFYVFMSILLVSLIALAVNRYTRRMTQRLEKKHREEAEKERIAADLHMANQIQSAVLPSVFPAFPDRSEFDIYATMNPAREVGGDFYDFFMIDDDHLGLVMADVSGKGIPAALFMMNAKSIVQNCAMLGRSPADILTKTNEAVCKQNKMEMFVTVWVGILEISTGILTAANAGHEYPAVRRAGGEFELFKDKHGFVVGGMEGIRYKEYSLSLSPGDKLFLYTDGVPEASDSGQQLFGTERMLAALNQDPEASPETILENERRSVDRFVQNAEQFDDLTMMCLEYKGAQ